ncbi:hypothetical protein DFJ73DRAFT_306949 [Zopfochytrium polystomum]|nr:hypothetical protein DFJ73DRAFT_306949 [Zopfochytrium polystomum]
MAREGRPLRTLSICLERVGSWGLADWVVLSRCLPGVTSVRLESRGNCLPLETVAWILSAFKGSRCSLKIFVKVSEPQGEAIWLSPLSDWCHSESGRGRDPISHREDLTAAIESKSHLPFHVPNPQQPMTFPSAPNGDRGPVIDLILESSTKSGCSEQELALLFEQIQSLTIVPIVTQLHVSRLSLGAFLPTRLVSSSSTSLTQLHLRQVNLGATGVLDLLGQLSFTGTHLISLDLAANIARSDQRAAEAGFAISKWLATATASRLRCLGLSRNYFCSAGALAIAEGCKPPACPSLTEVDCSGLDLGIALPRLVHALLGSNQSRRVALRSLNVSDPSAPPRLLAETLVLLTATSGVGGTGRAQQLGPGHPQQYQQHLTALNLSRAALTPPLLPLLGRAVSSLSSLATLTLQGSFVEGKDSRVDPLAPPLEDAGFASLCAHLDGPLPLRRLDVSFQRLGDASCLRLGEMMCGMLPRLCAVGFRGNCTTEQGMNSLEDLLDRVGGSRRVIVDFRGNPIEQTSTAAATRGRQRVRLRGFGAKVVVVGEWDCHNNNDGWTGQDEAK